MILSEKLQMSNCRRCIISCLLIVLTLLNQFHPVICQCSGSSLDLTATQEIQYLTSVNYNNGAGSYTSNLDCSWKIDSGGSSLRVIIYVTAIDITCAGDVINVYDGESTASSSLASNVCGTSYTTVLTSTSQYMFIRFTTDASNQATGFKIAYLHSHDLSGTGCTADQLLTPTTSAQYLTSPSFPNLYDTSANCRWIITAPSGNVNIEIIFSDIENSVNCAFDSMEIYDGDYVCENTKVASICSRHPNTVTTTYQSNGTSFLVKFASDGSLSFQGFLLKYSYTESVSTSSSTVTATEDNFMLGIGIGCACGATAAFLSIVVVMVIKNRCRASNKKRRVKTVKPLDGAPATRSPSIPGIVTPIGNGSAHSSDSQTNGFVKRTNMSRSSSISNEHIKRNGHLP